MNFQPNNVASNMSRTELSSALARTTDKRRQGNIAQLTVYNDLKSSAAEESEYESESESVIAAAKNQIQCHNIRAKTDAASKEQTKFAKSIAFFSWHSQAH